jgi:hypothetical protein
MTAVPGAIPFGSSRARIASRSERAHGRGDTRRSHRPEAMRTSDRA